MVRKKGITDEMIVEMYLSGMAVKDIAEKVGITPAGVSYIRNKHGIKAIREQSSGQPRKHKVNEDFFKVWSHDMAWVLGLFVTDGTVNKSVHSITFSQKDERILKVVARLMDADFVLATSAKTRTTPTLLINSREIKKDLEAMGITNNKSLSFPFPSVPDEFWPSFIRGVIDGDGNVDKHGYYVIITTASYGFAQGLLKVFSNWNLNPKIRSFISEHETKIYRVVIAGKNKVIYLSNIIYKNVSIYDNFIIYKRLYLSQHSEDPFIADDKRKVKAWIIENNEIIHVNNNRKSIKTYVSNTLINELRDVANANNTKINYLIEPIINQLINTSIKIKSEQMKPKDRVEFRTTFDKELVERMKLYKNANNMKLNEIIEYGMNQYLKGNENHN